MTSLLTILVALWVVMTIALVVVWFERRRRRSAEGSPFEVPPPIVIGELSDSEGTEVRTEDHEPAADGEDGIDTDELEDELQGDFDKEVVMATDSAPRRSDDFFRATGSDNGDDNGSDHQDNNDDHFHDDHNHDDSREDTTTTRSLLDILNGIQLPYDLMPIPSAVEDPERHLIFLTTHSNAEEVGTKFADELIRIGFEFEPVGLDQAIAVRDDDVVSMTIVPRAGEVENGSGPRYGAADISDVALEVWIGRSTSPPVVTG